MHISSFSVIFIMFYELSDIKCLDVYDFTYPLDQQYYSYCHTKNGSIGHCSLASKCPQAAIDYQIDKIQPVLCYFQQEEPVICCPRSSSNKKPPIKVNPTDKGQFNVISDKVNDKPLQSIEKCKNVYSQPIKIKLKPGEFQIAVAGGIKTEVGEFPHMAAIGWSQLDNFTDWRCGGSLISENYVLTAAHCINKKDLPDIIRIGEMDLFKNDEFDIPADFNIKNIIVHPDYSRKSRYNDIALIELNITAELSKKVRPACLWQNYSVNYTEALVTGYGHVVYKQAVNLTSNLLKADLELISNDECGKNFPQDSSLKNGIVETQICAGDMTGIKDTCQGDSGGPLQIQIADDEQVVYHIIGITSFGRACATGSPGVYTRVSSYLNWIESIVWPTNS